MINLVYGSGAEIGDPALASPDLAGVHFTGSTPVFQSMWKTIGNEHRELPQLPAHRRRDRRQGLHRRAPLRRRRQQSRRRSSAASFEYQGQKCSAASRVFAPSNLWPEIRERVVEEVRSIKMGDVSDFQNFMGAVIDAGLVQDAEGRDRRGRGRETRSTSSSAAGTTTRRATSSSRRCSRRPIPNFRTMRDELFGPVVTTYVYPEGKYGETLEMIDQGAPYGLTGAVFARERDARRAGGREAAVRGGQLLRQRQADRRGRRPAAVRRRARIGHERQGRIDVEPDPLGQPRTIKETFVPPTDYRYPFMAPEDGRNST